MPSNADDRETRHRPGSNRLNILCAHIHQGLLSWIPPYLAEMGEIVDDWFSRHSLPEIILPLITCQAVNGTPEDPRVLRACTAILSGLVSLHILDDLRDANGRDSLCLKVGRTRAAHYASAFESLSNQLWVKVVHAGDASEAVFETCSQGTMIALAGRNRVLSHSTGNWQAYWKTVEMTSAHPSGQLAAAGAMLSTAHDALVDCCNAFGRSLGLIRHLVTEYQDMWGSGDHRLSGHSITRLPILYGLQCDHPHRTELAEIVRQHGVDQHRQRVMEILDAIGAKDYLIWAALLERKRALRALEPCPNEEGKQLLKAFLASRLEQISAIAGEDVENPPHAEKVKIPGPLFDPEELSDSIFSPSYRSIGLELRHQIRQTPLLCHF